MKELKVIVLMFIVLLLTACSKNEDSPEETQPVINVYVYSPDHPTITRGDIGNVNPIDNTINESLITSLQIWVFEHGTNTLVSYYQPETVRNLNDEKGVTYQLNVSEAFAKADPKPTVDVYVVANVTSKNCGLSYDKNTTRATLEGALIGTGYFGLSPLTTTVPAEGLPMSGVLRDVAVTGSAPVFKISSVKLTRAVSKLRFIFSKDVNTSVKITGIKLGVKLDENDNLDLDQDNNIQPESQIPTEEFLFLKADHSLYHIGETYETGGTALFTGELAINSNDDPIKYTYQPGQSAQDYENLIAEGLKKVPAELSQVGPFYLRESNKQLSGVITYQIGDAAEKNAVFKMKTAGDFSRNHTWIVYAYYGVDGMQVITVYSQDWQELNSTNPHNVYNW